MFAGTPGFLSSRLNRTPKVEAGKTECCWWWWDNYRGSIYANKCVSLAVEAIGKLISHRCKKQKETNPSYIIDN